MILLEPSSDIGDDSSDTKKRNIHTYETRRKVICIICGLAALSFTHKHLSSFTYLYTKPATL